MTAESTSAIDLLIELTALPSIDQRCAHVRARGANVATLASLAEAVEHLAVSDVTAALQAGVTIVDLADALGGAAEQARARRARAQALAYAGNAGEALQLNQEAAEIADRGGAPIEAARARMSSIHALASLGRLDEAVQAGEYAYKAFQDAGETMLAARADSNLGTIHRMRDDPARALVHLDRARAVLSQEPVAAAQIDANRAHALMDLDRFEAAELAYQAALPEFEHAQMSWAAAIVEGNLADLATRQGRLQKALFHFERARRHLERDTASAELARLTMEQSHALATLGLIDDALDGYRSALHQLEELGHKQEIAAARGGIGRMLVLLGRLREAEPVLAATADEYEALGQAVARARLDLIRAELLNQLGNYSAAQSLTETASAALHERPTDAAAAHNQLAGIALRRGDWQTAETEVDRAINEVAPLGIRPLLAELLHTRGEVRRARGDQRAAAADFRAGIEHVERVRGALQAERFRTAFLGDRLSLYDDLICTILDDESKAGVAEAFAVVERAKSRALLDLVRGQLDDADVESAADPAERDLKRDFQRLQADLSALYSRMADSTACDAAALRRREQIEQIERALETLEVRLATTGGSAGLFAAPIDAGALQAHLTPNTALIEYYIAGDELLAFTVSRGALHVFRRLLDAGDLQDRVQRIQFQMQRGLRPGAAAGPRGERLLSDARRELGELHNKVFAPLAPAIGDAERLIIVPHGPLHAVPFAALWDGKAYLLERFAVTHAPSASLLTHLSPRRDAESGDVLIVGVADEKAPEIAREAQRIAAALPGARVLLNEEATTDRVLDAMSRAGVIHIACHGHFSTRSPLSSGLRMADRWLTVRDLCNLRLAQPLLALSGCETGRNVVDVGDELLGLVRGLIAAGAGALVVSLWPVSDESTAQLMTSFYQAFAGDRARTAAGIALRSAQRESIKHNPHPAFWAPFVLMGDV